MNADAHLIGHDIYNELGCLERVEWSWEGGDIAAISDRFLKRDLTYRGVKRKGDVILAGPLRLRVIGEEFPGLSIYVMRDGWKAHVKRFTYHLMGTLDLIYRRLIITAVVWGLADFHEACIPSWQDIHALKRFVKK